MSRRKLERAALILAILFVTASIVNAIDLGPKWLAVVVGVFAALTGVMVLDWYRARRLRTRRAR
ncbi:MAG: hypothetical protein E6G31_10645 [Actinobacteria bacterium]|nr:MAG: hypothetical protein E6G31_10645 [Actinomycetota bacterium]